MPSAPGALAPPIILLAYVADLPEEEEPARNLAEERRRLLAALDPLRRKGLANVLLRTDVTAASLTQLLHRHRNHIAILHFGGHGPGSARLLTSGEAGQAAYQPLAVLLEQLPNLQLVFISGCLSEPLADQLLDRSAPVVAGTLAHCADDAAITLTEHFYADLAAGAGLEAAYQQAAAAVKLICRTPAAAWRRDAAASTQGAWPWMRCGRRGADDARTWNIPAAAGDYFFGLPPLPHAPLPENPYHQALAWYGPEQASIFFGRSRQIHTLHRRLAGRDGSPLLLLSGQSGVGKSSLLEAGLIPRLQGEFDVCYVRRDATAGAAATLR